MAKQLAVLVALVLSLGAVPASASTISFTAGSCTVSSPFGTSGLGGFDTLTCGFTPTAVSSLDITNEGSGLIDPGAHGPYGVLLDLWNGTTWINVFTSATYSAPTVNLSAIFTSPINFPAMTASSLRMHGTSDVGWSFHSVNAGMTFDLTSAVPAPMPLLLIALGFLGLVARRRITIA